MLAQEHQLTAPLLSFMKAICLFNMQGPKVNKSKTKQNKKTTKGLNKVDVRVVNQQETSKREIPTFGIFSFSLMSP